MCMCVIGYYYLVVSVAIAPAQYCCTVVDHSIAVDAVRPVADGRLASRERTDATGVALNNLIYKIYLFTLY